MKDKRPIEQDKNQSRFFTSVKNGWQKLKKSQKIAIIVSAAFLVLICTGIWYYVGVLDNEDTIIPDRSKDPDAQEVIDGGNTPDELEKWDPIEQFNNQNIINYVLLGFDTNDERKGMAGESWYGQEGFAGARPDSIRVITVNLDTNTMAVISIPRDTYVQIANTNHKDKINSSYMYGRQAARNQGITDEKEISKRGIEYVMQTIENALGGIPMDYYMAVDFDTVVNFVDKIGGVRYNVEIKVTDENGNVMLEPGEQVLNGTQAFIYLQDRTHTTDGDIGRTQHHTLFMKAMAKQLLQNGKIVEALKILLFDKDMGNIETNMSVAQVMATGNIAAKRLNLTDVNPHLLECRLDSMNGISFVVIDQAARTRLLKDVFDYDFTPEPQEDLQDTVPAPPTDFTAQMTGDGMVLKWEPGDSHNTTFNLWRNGELIAEGLTEKLYLDTGYTSGSVTYELQAVNYSAVSTKVTKTVQAGPSSPTHLKASFDPYTTTIKLTWDYSGDGVTFTIYKSDGDGTGRRIERNYRQESYSDGDVEFDKTYTYWVTAVDDDGVESSRAKVVVPTGDTPVSYTMTMAVAGTGTGEITPKAGAYAEAKGTVIAIKANPTGTSTFGGWTVTSGSAIIANSGEKNTTVTVNGNCTITATFNGPAAYTMTLAKAGSGTGNLNPSAGSYAEAPGTMVSISATPTGGSTFAGWSKTGNCTIADAGSLNTSVTVNGDCTVTATFNPPPTPTTYTLTMAKAGTGGGTLTPPSGTSTQTAGVDVPITATPSGTDTFAGWAVTSGSATIANPSSLSTTVRASANCTITATFNAAAVTYPVSVTMNPSGAGTAAGTGDFVEGATITVIISETDPGVKVFDHWENTPPGASENGKSISFSMPAGPVNLTAVFVDPTP